MPQNDCATLQLIIRRLSSRRGADADSLGETRLSPQPVLDLTSMEVVSQVWIEQVLVDRWSEVDRPRLSPYVKTGRRLLLTTGSIPTCGRGLMKAVMANTREHRCTV